MRKPPVFWYTIMAVVLIALLSLLWHPPVFSDPLNSVVFYLTLIICLTFIAIVFALVVVVDAFFQHKSDMVNAGYAHQQTIEAKRNEMHEKYRTQNSVPDPNFNLKQRIEWVKMLSETVKQKETVEKTITEGKENGNKTTTESVDAKIIDEVTAIINVLKNNIERAK